MFLLLLLATILFLLHLLMLVVLRPTEAESAAAERRQSGAGAAPGGERHLRGAGALWRGRGLSLGQKHREVWRDLQCQGGAGWLVFFSDLFFWIWMMSQKLCLFPLFPLFVCLFVCVKIYTLHPLRTLLTGTANLTVGSSWLKAQAGSRLKLAQGLDWPLVATAKVIADCFDCLLLVALEKASWILHGSGALAPAATELKQWRR